MRKIINLFLVLLVLQCGSNAFAATVNELKTVRQENLNVSVNDAIPASISNEPDLMTLGETNYFTWDNSNDTATYQGNYLWSVTKQGASIFIINEQEDGSLTLICGDQQQKGITTTQDNPLVIALPIT